MPLPAGKAGSFETDFAGQVRSLCSESGDEGTAYKIAARTAAESVEKVILAASRLKDAALSLGQEEDVSRLIAELHRVAEALLSCGGEARRELVWQDEDAVESVRPALPQWWFALSEVLQVTEREIGFLTSIGHGQPRDTPARRLCTLVIRVLRKHHRLLLAEAEDWMDVSENV